MNRNTSTCYLAELVLIASLTSTGCNKQTQYEDCVIDGVKTATIPAAIIAVKNACRDKFPEKKIPDTTFNAEMMKAITGKASVGESQIIGTLYHTNQEWIITQVLIAVSPSKESGLSDPEIKERTKLYTLDLRLEPFKEQDFMLQIERALADKSWGIVEAKGRKKDVE